MLIVADGKIDEKEIALGQQMSAVEGISRDEFSTQMVFLKSKDLVKLYQESLAGLKRLDRKQQIRAIAWLCVVANADGFMDRSEWQFIYKVYHKELGLPLDEIMAVQKNLNIIKQQVSPALERSKVIV